MARITLTCVGNCIFQNLQHVEFQNVLSLRPNHSGHTKMSTFFSHNFSWYNSEMLIWILLIISSGLIIWSATACFNITLLLCCLNYCSTFRMFFFQMVLAKNCPSWVCLSLLCLYVKSKHMVIGTGYTAGTFSPVIFKCSSLIVSIQFPNQNCEQHLIHLNWLFQISFSIKKLSVHSVF